MTALIVLNGKTDDCILDFAKVPELMENIYCADGGANFLYEHRIIPKMILGDMDSISDEAKSFYEEQNCEFVLFPKEKDETDGQLIVDQIIKDGANMAVMLCSLGGRLDHTLGNIQLMYRMLKRGTISCMISRDESIYMSDCDFAITGEKNQLVSIIPYEDNTVLSLKGFGYDVCELKFEKDTPVGISNYLLDEVGSISVHSGCPLVILSNIAK